MVLLRPAEQAWPTFAARCADHHTRSAWIVLMTRTELVHLLDAGLLLTGVGLALAGLFVEVRRRGFRDPLADVSVAPPGPTIAHLLLVMLVLFMLMGLAGSIATALVNGVSVRPGSTGWHAQQLAQGVANLLVAGLCLILLAPTRSSVVSTDEAQSAAAQTPPRMPAWRTAVSAAWMTLAVTPICLLLWSATQAAWSWLGPAPAATDHPVLRALSDSAWGVTGVVLLVIGAVLIAPLFEELLFRGVFLQAVLAAGARPWTAVLASAVVFGLLHSSRPADVPPLILLGVALGVLRLRTGSLTACVLAHALFNGRTMLIALLAPELVRGD